MGHEVGATSTKFGWMIGTRDDGVPETWTSKETDRVRREERNGLPE